MNEQLLNITVRHLIFSSLPYLFSVLTARPHPLCPRPPPTPELSGPPVWRRDPCIETFNILPHPLPSTSLIHHHHMRHPLRRVCERRPPPFLSYCAVTFSPPPRLHPTSPTALSPPSVLLPSCADTPSSPPCPDAHCSPPTRRHAGAHPSIAMCVRVP